MKKGSQGALTVEAAIILPVYILVMVFILNFMNVFYTQLAVQEGLNNVATTLAQYCYAANLLIDIDKIQLSEETSAHAGAVISSTEKFTNDLKSVVNILKDGFNLNRLDELVETGKELGESVSELGTAMSAISGSDIVNALLTGAVEVGGSAALTALMDRYLDKMKVNRTLIDGPILFTVALDSSHHSDLVLTARYHYKDPLLSMFVDSIEMKQSVVVHPWIGGSTPGFRQRKK